MTIDPKAIVTLTGAELTEMIDTEANLRIQIDQLKELFEEAYVSKQQFKAMKHSKAKTDALNSLLLKKINHLANYETGYKVLANQVDELKDDRATLRDNLWACEAANKLAIYKDGKYE